MSAAETDLEHEGAPPPDEEVVVLDEGQEAAPETKKPDEPKRKPKVDGVEDKDAEYSAKVQKRIAQLAKERREERTAREREQARADALERQLNEFRKSTLTTAEARFNSEFEKAKAAHRKAISEGDADVAADTAAQLAEIAAQRQDVQRQQQYTPQPQQRQQAAQFTPKTQAYIDQNPWFESDEDARDTAIAADASARKKGIAPDTPAYFEFVTKRVQALHPEHFEEDGEEEADEPPRRAAAPPVAPAKRTVPGVQASKGKLPPLTAAEGEFCRNNNLDLKTYALNKARRAAERAAEGQN